MPELLFNRAIPDRPEELAPGCRPFDATECDARLTLTDPLTGRRRIVERRIRRVRLVSEDQSTLYPVLEDMGPATGEDGITIPCDGLVEMSHIRDLLSMAVARRKEAERKRALILPIRQAAMREGVLNHALDLIAWQKGQSTFGYGGFKQRS